MKKLGLYIHIPFCKTICVYCAFPTYANKHSQIVNYLKRLKQEIVQCSSNFKNYKIDTIYFGGGTPSLLESEQIKNLLIKIQTSFYITSDAEISIECNPESLTQQKILDYQKIGITRISLGIQSLNNKTLWKIARPHNLKQIFQALDLLNKNNWKNFGLDIIMGLPYQTLEDFKNEILTLLNFNPVHFSAYFLSYDTKRIDTFIKESVSEKIQVEMYNFLIQKLAEEGFEHYEVSNYAKPKFQCQHNLKYWKQQEYLGLGLGAHSYINGQLFENSEDFNQYLKNNRQFKKYQLSEDEKRMDLIMLSLRTYHGLDLEKYNQEYGIKKTKELLLKAKKFLQLQEIIIDRKKIFLTEKGYLFSDQIYRNLI